MTLSILNYTRVTLTPVLLMSTFASAPLNSLTHITTICSRHAFLILVMIIMLLSALILKLVMIMYWNSHDHSYLNQIKLVIYLLVLLRMGTLFLDLMMKQENYTNHAMLMCAMVSTMLTVDMVMLLLCSTLTLLVVGDLATSTML